MALSLSDAELQTIADQLFLLKSPKPAPLPKPTNTTGPNSLASKLDPIGSDARFNDIGIGVVDFTSDVMSPRVWLKNGGVSWRIASTAKISILLAAVQLRDDVRRVKDTGLISTASDFDELFSKIWLKSRDTGIRKIAERGSGPRVSTVFDLTKSPVDFIGADTSLDRPKLSAIGISHLQWSGVPDLTFWERLWLAGTQSDNVAASSCISEIGVAYMKAVLGAYGLFDPVTRSGLLLAWEYAQINANTPVNRSPGAPKYRPLPRRDMATIKVKDKWNNSDFSTQAGSAAALTAYMIALMQDKLVDTEGCDTIRTHLADETSDTTYSLIVDGARRVESVITAHTKLGYLGVLHCEFAYLEVGGLRYAVVATGILPKQVGLTRYDWSQQGEDLGERVYTVLKNPP